MAENNKQLIKLLGEAHSNEAALINTLTAHHKIAEGGPYKSLIQSHLSETRDHAKRLQRRLDELGYSKSLFALGYSGVQNLVKQSLVLTKGPIDAIRGGGNTKEKMVRNAMDEAMTEGMEIGSYDTIEAYARSIGDHKTAELAADIRLDEERMFEALRKEIPALAEQAARVEAPTAGTDTEPWEGYDDMTVDEIRDRLDEASASLVQTVASYEKKNKNRTTVIELTERERASV
jgi:ferritin-like metal-binding protein YciE